MRRYQVIWLTIVLLGGCAALPQLKRPSVASNSKTQASDAPMSQLGVPLPAMKPGDERKLKILAGDQMAQHGYWSEAADLYLQAEMMAPGKPKLDAQLAPALAGAGQFPEAIQRYRRLIKNDPSNAGLLSNLAFTLMESGDPKSTESEYRQALTIDSNYENAAVNLGLLLARQKRYEEALGFLVPAVGEAAAHHNLGVIAIDCGDEATAQQEFARAAACPGTPKATQEFLAALATPKLAHATNKPIAH